MVVKLQGIIDGQSVIFERDKGDWWKAAIPRNLNGVYIVELTAIDAAGNMAYCAKYIITIDLSALCVHIEPYPYYAEVLEPDFYATVVEVGCGGMKI